MRAYASSSGTSGCWRMGERLGEGDTGGAAHAGRVGGRARLLAGDLGDIDDCAAALRAQHRDHEAAGADRGEDLEIQVVDPGFVGDRLERIGGSHAGVVDKGVNPSEALVRGADEALDVLSAAHVGAEREAFAAGGRDGGGDLLEGLLAPRADGDLGALVRESLGRRFANAFAAARHERDLTLEAQVHRWCPPARLLSLWFHGVRGCQSMKEARQWPELPYDFPTKYTIDSSRARGHPARRSTKPLSICSARRWAVSRMLYPMRRPRSASGGCSGRHWAISWSRSIPARSNRSWARRWLRRS